MAGHTDAAGASFGLVFVGLLSAAVSTIALCFCLHRRVAPHSNPFEQLMRGAKYVAAVEVTRGLVKPVLRPDPWHTIGGPGVITATANFLARAASGADSIEVQVVNASSSATANGN